MNILWNLDTDYRKYWFKIRFIYTVIFTIFEKFYEFLTHIYILNKCLKHLFISFSNSSLNIV